MTETIVLSTDNVHDVRSKIISLLKGKMYTTVTDDYYGINERKEQRLDRQNDGVYAFIAAFTETPEARIQISDSWGVYSVLNSDELTFEENSVTIKGFSSRGCPRQWTFTVD